MKPILLFSLIFSLATIQSSMATTLTMSAEENPLTQRCEHFDEAKSLYQQAKQTSNKKQAIQLYQQIIQRCPNVAEFQFDYAKSLQNDGQTKQALNAYQQALQDPSINQNQLIYTHLFMMKIYLDKKQRTDAFIEQSKLKNLFKVHVESQLDNARQYFNQLQQELNNLTNEQPFNGQELNNILTLSRNLSIEAPEISYQIPFAFDQNQPTKEGVNVLRQVALSFISIAAKKIEVIGHTDLKGTDDYNQKLSERRAKSVVKLLEQLQPRLKGKLVAIGKGKSEPLSTEQSEAADILNRRVAFVID